jgi:hypothetical protein
MTAESLKITALTPEQAAKILASAYRRRIDAEQVREVVEEARIIRADGTFSLIEYVAYLAREVTGGHDPRID